ncbi:MAG: DUF2007 domain-containing protein [Candidatus Omnitrophica bacterium]|nr:DUF2007 domain-containing protein [Candidatus Omnitrophota bacterium]
MDKKEIIARYDNYNDEALLEALLLPEDDYQEGVYEILINLCKQRGLESKLAELRESKEETVPQAEETAQELVTVGKFLNVIDAHIAKTRLESEGIECYIQDENLVTLNWLYSNAIGGVRLQVNSADSSNARQILSDFKQPIEETDQPDNPSEQTLICPECKSKNVYREKISKKGMVFWQLLGVPLFGWKRKTKCFDCNAEW